MAQPGLTNAEVLEQVRRLVGQRRVTWTRHLEEMLAERGLAKDQVIDCLRIGYFEEDPVIPNRAGDIEYKFRMRATVDGEQISVVASLIPQTRVVAITVFDPEKRN